MRNRKLAAASASALLAGAAVVGVQASTATTAHAKDPCFFSQSDFGNWYNGARWGASIATVESYAGGCPGAWEPYGVDWKGDDTKNRVWPRSDGGRTEIIFAYVNGAWKSHDHATTYNYTGYSRKECEWPRPPGNPCSATP